MKRWIALTCLSSVLCAQEAPPAKVSYDTDLFRKDKKTIFVNAEFLYWAVDEPGLDYAIKMRVPAWGPTSVYANGDYKDGHLGWGPGFRVNVGYFNAPHYWDAYAQYTSFYTGDEKHVYQPSNPALYLNGTWPQPNPAAGSAPLQKAASVMGFHYHVADLLASRRFYPNPHFRMMLIGGATAAWIRQFWNIYYTDTNAQGSHIKNSWRFSGAGIRAGFSLDWFLGKQEIYITGKATAAILGGNYHNYSRQTTTYAPSSSFDTATPIGNAHYQNNRVVGHAQILAGPSWQHSFSTVRTELFLGYEFNIWNNLHEVLQSGSNTPQGSKTLFVKDGLVVMQGGTLRLNLDF